MRQHREVIIALLLALAAGAAWPAIAAAQAEPSDQRAASRALRVAKDIMAPGASDSARAAAYREATRVLDSAEAAGGLTPVTRVARLVTVGYVVQRSLREVGEGTAPGARCAAARRARAYADTLRGLLPGADHSPSPSYQARLRWWFALPDSAAAAERAACR